MCGIVVAISPQQPVDRGRFEVARDTLVHRGPDAAGSVFLQDDRVALGHRRLSILDLSEAGNQPMSDGTLWVTYNGEIYNYPELRLELEKLGCRFRTRTDTEVLLHGYRIWGKDICSHLEGMFAFAIWDDQNRDLFLGRDHVGQKPLYYAHTRRHFIAASEIKAIRAFAGEHFRLRPESILDTIIYDFVPEPFTWYEGVQCLLPGHCLTVRADGSEISHSLTEYWTYSPAPSPKGISAADALDKLGYEIEKAVKSHLLADVEVGAFLSGGADSSCIVSLASKFIDHRIKTFSIGFGLPDDELPLARETARHVGAIHKEDIVTKADVQHSLASVLDIFDQPFADSSLVPTERVAALAAKDVKVVLTGDGGDEVFGGYNLGWYLSPALDIRLGQRIGLSVAGAKFLFTHIYHRLNYLLFGAKAWQSQDNFQPYRRSMREEVLGCFGTDLASAVREYDPRWAFSKYRDMELDPFRRAQWLHTKTILPGKMLVKVDRCSMQHSLEARSPFLSRSLVETMLDMPSEIRNPGDNWYKGLFRAWVRDKVPRNVVAGKKRGFGVPRVLYPDLSAQKGVDSLRLCAEGGLIRRSAFELIKRKPKLYWKLLQVERALDLGLFDPPQKN